MNLRNLAIWVVIGVVLIGLYGMMNQGAKSSAQGEVSYSQLLSRIDMKVLARIGAADRHDNEFTVLEDELVADGRLEQMTVVVDPQPQVERRGDRHGVIIAGP